MCGLLGGAPEDLETVCGDSSGDYLSCLIHPASPWRGPYHASQGDVGRLERR